MQLLRGTLEKITTNRLYVLLLLFILVLGVYYNTLSYPFIFDDQLLTQNQPQVRQGIAGIPSIFGFHQLESGTWHFSPPYRPMRLMSYAIDFELFNQNPAGYRFMNMVYHTLTSLVVFLLATYLLRNRTWGLLAALLFALHPVQINSVTYISGRRDILCGLFYFLGFYTYLIWRQRGQLRLMVLYFVFLSLALMSKEMAVTLPVICLASNFLLPTSQTPRLNRKMIAFFTISFLLVLIVVLHTLWIVPASYRAGEGITNTALLSSSFLKFVIPHADTLYAQLLLTIKLIASYFKLLIFPYPLLGDYSYNGFPVPKDFFSFSMIFNVLILVMLVFGFYRSIRKRQYLITLAFAWIIISLLPVLQIIPHHEIFAEHYLYIPLFGFVLAVAFFLSGLRQKPLVLSLVILLTSYVTLLYAQNQNYQSNTHFWSQVLKHQPYNARALEARATRHAREGEYGIAIKQYKKSIALLREEGVRPFKLAYYFYNLGETYRQTKQFEAAINAYREVSRRDPKFALGWLKLGMVYAASGDNENTLDFFQKARRLSPLNPEVLEQIIAWYLDHDKVDEAKKTFYELSKILNLDMRTTENIWQVMLKRNRARFRKEPSPIDITKTANAY